MSTIENAFWLALEREVCLGFHDGWLLDNIVIWPHDSVIGGQHLKKEM